MGWYRFSHQSIGRSRLTAQRFSQPGTSQQVEDAQRIALPGKFPQLLTQLSLLSGASRATLDRHEGWPAGCRWVCRNNIYHPEQPFYIAASYAAVTLMLRLARVPFNPRHHITADGVAPPDTQERT